MSGVVIIGDGLLGYRSMLWRRVKARKRADCWVSGKPILPGSQAYAPISNGKDRYRRILASVLEPSA